MKLPTGQIHYILPGFIFKGTLLLSAYVTFNEKINMSNKHKVTTFFTFNSSSLLIKLYLLISRFLALHGILNLLKWKLSHRCF